MGFYRKSKSKASSQAHAASSSAGGTGDAGDAEARVKPVAGDQGRETSQEQNGAAEKSNQAKDNFENDVNAVIKELEKGRWDRVETVLRNEELLALEEEGGEGPSPGNSGILNRSLFNADGDSFMLDVQTSGPVGGSSGVRGSSGDRRIDLTFDGKAWDEPLNLVEYLKGAIKKERLLRQEAERSLAAYIKESHGHEAVVEDTAPRRRLERRTSRDVIDYNAGLQMKRLTEGRAKAEDKATALEHELAELKSKMFETKNELKKCKQELDLANKKLRVSETRARGQRRASTPNVQNIDSPINSIDTRAGKSETSKAAPSPSPQASPSPKKKATAHDDANTDSKSNLLPRRVDSSPKSQFSSQASEPPTASPKRSPSNLSKARSQAQLKSSSGDTRRASMKLHNDFNALEGQLARSASPKPPTKRGAGAAPKYNTLPGRFRRQNHDSPSVDGSREGQGKGSGNGSSTTIGEAATSGGEPGLERSGSISEEDALRAIERLIMTSKTKRDAGAKGADQTSLGAGKKQKPPKHTRQPSGIPVLVNRPVSPNPVSESSSLI